MRLTGCRATPLGGYLAALGALRAVTRLLDPLATGRWDGPVFVLDSAVPDLVTALHERFEPAAVVSPWNAGSGFAGNGRAATAEAALAAIRASTNPRLHELRAAVTAADDVVADGRARGWGGRGDDLWDKARKADVLTLCRARFPDAALPWLDAVAALGQDDTPAFSRLLGTGGNFGRQDLSATYLARVTQALTHKHSTAWLRAALVGDESVPYLRDAVGQFDPGRAGGIQSSPLEKADDKGFVNPWSFLLTMEGALLFATAVVRRFGAQNSRAALPFQVRGSTSGHGSAAAGEEPLGELWAPLWSTPASLADVTHLLAEGRAHWRGGPARSGLDFARAVASLGVDRGITAFERHVFVDRLGQNPLAVPAGRVVVRERRGVAALAGLDPWLDALRRATAPTSVAARVRAVEAALFDHARGGSGLTRVFAAVGTCHEAVARSGTVRAAVSPLVLEGAAALLPDLVAECADDPALRLALVLATARDPGTGPATLDGLRPLLSPVTAVRGQFRPAWSDTPTLCPPTAGLLPALAEAARRRAMPGAVSDSAEPAVGGVRVAFRRGCVLAAADLDLLVLGGLDAERAAALLAGLLTVDWRAAADRVLGADDATVSTRLRTDLLLPFTSDGVVRFVTRDGTRRVAVLRPGSHWPVLLAAGRVGEVLADAAFRLRLAGVPYVVGPVAANGASQPALAALLLLRLAGSRRAAALRRVAAQPSLARDLEVPA